MFTFLSLSFGFSSKFSNVILGHKRHNGFKEKTLSLASNRFIFKAIFSLLLGWLLVYFKKSHTFPSISPKLLPEITFAMNYSLLSRYP